MPAPHRDIFSSLGRTGLGVIDVGSRAGLHPMFNEVAPLVEAVGFEPDVEEWERLRTGGQGSAYRSLTFFPFGLAATDGERTLHLCRSRGVSSFYRPNYALVGRFPDAGRFEIEAEVRIPVRSIDSLVADPSVALPKHIDFMKIDTQGSELDILRGAARTLREQVVAIEVEVEFARLYQEQPLFQDVNAFLVEYGFTLFKLRRLEWVRRTLEHRPSCTAGQVMFGDALYLRDPLDAQGAWSPRDDHQAEALVLVAVLYDLHDFALELLETPPVASLVDSGRIGRYVRERGRRLNRSWWARQAAIDFVRSVRAAMTGRSHVRRYEESWARGDANFYSRV